jgi:HK97 gp10 family phage protein
MITMKLEGLAETVAALSELPKATQRNAVRRVLQRNAEPIANLASRIAPHRTGRLSYSISVSFQLTRRHRNEKTSEVEVYVGPGAGLGTLMYASFDEFGTSDTPAFAFMRGAWYAKQASTLTGITAGLKVEVEKAAARAARKVARFAGAG